MEPIRLRGARQNNLKGIDLDVWPGELLVVTGPSGAGKSSLALDTLYAEGQRRFIESFSPYARQFLDRSRRPEVDELTPAPPAIAVDRAAPARSGRSTVATRTEIADHVKLLFARAAEASCERCGGPVAAVRPESIAAGLVERFQGERAVVWFPHRCGRDVADLLAAREALLPLGFTRVALGREVADLAELRPSDLERGAVVDGELRVVADRLVISAVGVQRLIEALESATRFGQGEVGVDVNGRTAIRTARGRRCERCGAPQPEPAPGLFSFNNPLGACEACSGFGRIIELDPDKVVENPLLTLAEHPIRPFRGAHHEWERTELRRLCTRRGIPTDVPWKDLDPEHRRVIWEGEGHGRGRWFGVTAWFDWMESRSYKAHVRIQLARYRRYSRCPTCGGSRFSPASLRYRLAGLTIAELYALPCGALLEQLGSIPGDDPGTAVLVKEVRDRLQFLVDVGVGYLSLDRMTRTLSGGEAQRVGLATALGASLSGTLYVVDEPTAGLHPSDVPGLLGAVRRLSRAGNTVVVVDNNPAGISQADRIADLGPGAGERGGTLLFHGPAADLPGVAASRTAAMLRPRPGAAGQARARRESRARAWIRGAVEHNLKGIDVEVPLGVMVAVTGPSGSGKSTLVEHVLHRGLRRQRGEATEEPGRHVALEGFDSIGEVVLVDQSPLGRTSRGNPATYVKAWDVIRARLARQPEAVDAGLTASSFSFNVEGGRCEVCAGEGHETVEMQFLPDVRLTCPACGGRRFQDRVLEVRLEGKNVSELLSMTIDEVLALLAGDRVLEKRFAPLVEVGLGYLRVGQPLDTLSDGEAQRLKLSRTLSEVGTGALVIVDEPTVGLHPSDIDRLVAVFDRLVERGNSVMVVSHDMAVAAAADWVIDLGPGPGEGGGRVVAAGTPERVAATAGSRTAPHLAAVLAGRPAVVPARKPRRSRKSSAKADPTIAVRGARQHNLKRIDVEIPRGQVTVVTGPSGSGKSTLAFDVIHAEGQRRYLQSLSPFVRQYLPQLPRPEVDSVDGVPPSIALEPRTSTSGGATVATLTEVGHYLRLLYARVGVQRCPDCGVEARSRTPAEIRQAVAAVAAAGPVSLLARAVQHRKGTHKDVLARARALGFARVRVDGELHDVARPPKLDRYHEHDIDFEVASLAGRADVGAAVVDRALQLGTGTVRLLLADGEESILSVRRSCPRCGRGFGELDPTMFSHHSRYSACPTCRGTGVESVFDQAAVIDGSRPLGKGGLRLFELPMFRRSLGRRLRRIRTIPLERKFSELTEAQRRSLVEGRGGWPGLAAAVERLAEQGVAAAGAMLRRDACRECGGARLAAQPRNVVIGAGGPDPRSIGALMSLPVSQARRWMEALELDARERVLGDDLRRQVVRRLAFLEETGVGYLTLDRPAETLSGGETQRVRLAAQLGADLSGVCYVLDEPTVGLHPRDTMRLVGILRKLADSGSTLLVVEHDEQTIRAADHVIDLGPGGGTAGGMVVATGRPEAIERTPQSPTGRALARSGAGAPVSRRDTSGVPWLVIEGAAARNLRDLSVAIPLGRLTAFTGVSGSGKSTLVREVLFRALRQALGLVNVEPPGAFRRISGFEPLQRAIEIDQSPIGRTPRSVPATYVDIWGDVRRLLAQTPEARARGYGPDRFSFNRAGGRCEVCEGQGSLKIEMSFLPEVQAWCESCQGTRFDSTTREVTYRGLSVDRILALTAEEASRVFEPFPKIAPPLQMMCDLGIGYLTLGQPSNTLSGGEAQRIKLAAELRTRASGAALYVLDEPTTGLHALDVDRLIAVLQRLVDRGDTVVVIEHHTSVIWAADHVIDLGPDGGDGGGRVVVAGTPVEVREHASSYTGAALQQLR